MPHHRTVYTGILLLTLSLLLPAAVAQQVDPRAFEELPASPQLLQQVRQGGFVLYMRHGATDSAQPDQVPIDLNDCATQRPLHDAGRAEIIEVGNAIRRLGVPIDAIHVSPLCRAVESAQLAYGYGITVVNELMYTAHLTTAEKLPVVAMTRKLISEPVSEGSNRMIVAHAPNLADLMGYFPTVEGSLIIFRPLGNGEFEYLATIHPKDWAELLGGSGASE